MKNRFLIIILVFTVQQLFAQATPVKPIAAQILKAIGSGQEFFTSSPFLISPNDTLTSLLAKHVDSFAVLTIQPSELKKIIQAQPRYLRLLIPDYRGNQTEVLLQSHSITAPGFVLRTSSGEKMQSSDINGLHYWGMIRNQPGSCVAISIFDDEIMGVFSAGYGNINIGKIQNHSQYIIYNDVNLKERDNFVCENRYGENGNISRQVKTNGTRQTVAQNCVKLYWEINNDVFTKFGSLSRTVNFLTGVFNQHQMEYANDNITVALSELFIWNTNSPYKGSSSADFLYAFQTKSDAFNGDVGILIKISNSAGGIAGFIGGLCDTLWSHKKCLAGIYNYYYDIPVYSWTVNVVTHEQAHIMGTMHTHDCIWNGNQTAIDGCGPAALYPGGGSCPDGPIPVKGTIMSYCHLPPNPGIDLSLGFGPQPDSIIIANINAAPCLPALPCTGVSELAIKDNNPIIIYPNPNDGTFFIEFAHLVSTKVEFKMYNIIGKLVYDETQDLIINSGIYSKKIELPYNPTGIYFLQIIDSDNNRSNHKIVIE